jgi:chromosome segregation ATPase
MPEPVRATDQPDALASLEERILRAVALVAQLRKEKEAAEAKLSAVSAEQSTTAKTIEDLETENLLLKEELETLREERNHVRGRIEKLLSQMDSLAG